MKAARVGLVDDWIRDRVRPWIHRSDPQIGWFPFVVAAGRGLVRGQRFDAVYSSSFPITAHLIEGVSPGSRACLACRVPRYPGGRQTRG